MLLLFFFIVTIEHIYYNCAKGIHPPIEGADTKLSCLHFDHVMLTARGCKTETETEDLVKPEKQ